MLRMNPRRAFWEAVATVCIPTLVIWGVLLYFVRTNARSDEWPLYVVFIVLPLPLIFPVYKRYLRGPGTPNGGTPRSHFIAATVSASLGFAYVIFKLAHHRDTEDLVFHVVLGIGWLLIGGERLRRGIRARKSLAGQVTS
jgi:hypothetical protein